MKRKSSENSGHVVAWINKAEWDQVLEYLYSKDPSLQKYALHRISAWKGRFGNSTPVAVESTADLVRCQVLDSSGHLDPDDLVLLYGTALVRFVNLITERKQKKVATSLRRLADKMNIPEWIVNLRHDITHRKLPTLKWCRKGCKFVLEWLQQEYWSRQLGSRLPEHWDSQSEDEDDDEGGNEAEKELEKLDELTMQARKREIHRKARELLISYEQEEFQVLDGLHKENRANRPWPSPSSDLGWILMQIKDFAANSSDTLTDILLLDGFLVPSEEQLRSLDIDPSEHADPTAPCIPRLFLRLWLPLLRTLSSAAFVPLLLEKLFLQLQLSTGDSEHREFFIAGWIAEILTCNRHKRPNLSESKGQKKARLRDKIFTTPIPLPWQKVLTLCLGAPCLATPHLLQQILEDMECPFPPDTQRKLLHLCRIYTQGGDPSGSPGPEGAEGPIYTLENLRRTAQHHPQPAAGAASPLPCPGGSATPPRRTGALLTVVSAPAADDLLERLAPEVLAERVAALRGSPWQVCTDNVKWTDYPLGRVPGQSEDPLCLMVENYSTMSVFDQHVEIDKAGQHGVFASVPGPHHSSDGLLWTHSDLSKLKSGLQLF